MRELREALGRLVFVYGALTWDKPFLGPLFTFLSHHPPGTYVELPLYVKMVLAWMRGRLENRRAHAVRPRPRLEDAVFRVDAKAEGMTVAVGGWCPVRDARGQIQKGRSPWFSLRLDERTAPWAFCRGLPARAISALELLASTVALVLLTPAAEKLTGQRGAVAVTGFTDSQVASNVLRRGMTTSFPLCCVAMELAAQLEHRDAELCLEWTPREENREADALADGRTEGFSPALRAGQDFTDIGWLVLPDLMAAGLQFHGAVKRPVAGSAAPGSDAAAGKRRRESRLRDREPW